MCRMLHTAIFTVFVLLHVAEEQRKYGDRVNDLWKKKYKSQKDFTSAEENISLRTLINIKQGSDAYVSSERKMAQQMELPIFIAKGYFEGEIEIDDNGKWIVIKTGQEIIQYDPNPNPNSNP